MASIVFWLFLCSSSFHFLLHESLNICETHETHENQNNDEKKKKIKTLNIIDG